MSQNSAGYYRFTFFLWSLPFPHLKMGKRQRPQTKKNKKKNKTKKKKLKYTVLTSSSQTDRQTDKPEQTDQTQ